MTRFLQAASGLFFRVQNERSAKQKRKIYADGKHETVSRKRGRAVREGALRLFPFFSVHERFREEYGYTPAYFTVRITYESHTMDPNK